MFIRGRDGMDFVLNLVFAHAPLQESSKVLIRSMQSRMREGLYLIIANNFW